jgi:hypothetical protein
VNQLHRLDDWAGKGLSIAGVFHSLEDTATEANITRLFGVLWTNGYTPFANLYANRSARDIAAGKIDGQIRNWAKAYAQYTQNGTRTAFLAPLQEMNGSWVPYGGDPANYKLAFQHIQEIFAQEGVADSAVIWVFAPNGASDRGMAPFESYYPGDRAVDVVAFSSYNFGCHPSNRYSGWNSPEETYGPFLPRLRTMAPGKPIFIAQTGTTRYDCGDNNQKNEWLRQAYNYLASERDVQGIIYYNANVDYDWAFYIPGSVSYEGYRQAVSSASFAYIPPKTMRATFK